MAVFKNICTKVLHQIPNLVVHIKETLNAMTTTTSSKTCISILLLQLHLKSFHFPLNVFFCYDITLKRISSFAVSRTVSPHSAGLPSLSHLLSEKCSSKFNLLNVKAFSSYSLIYKFFVF